MGAVYLGYQEEGGRHVAIKVLSDQLAGNQAYVERFQREARSVLHLEHPNIVRGIEVGEDPATGAHFLVLEYVSRSSKRKDYDDNMDRYEHELKVPYYLLFQPDVLEMSLYRHKGARYASVPPNAGGKPASLHDGHDHVVGLGHSPRRRLPRDRQEYRRQANRRRRPLAARQNGLTRRRVRRAHRGRDPAPSRLRRHRPEPPRRPQGRDCRSYQQVLPALVLREFQGVQR